MNINDFRGEKIQIKTNGVSTQLPENPIYFKQMNVVEIVKIPPQKPDIEQVVDVTVNAKIMSARIIDTVCSKSYEGQLLSGKKLVLELKLEQVINYVADYADQPVHSAHYEEVMRSVFIIVPKEINKVPIERLLKGNKLKITPYIEDIYAEQRDKRTVFKNITLLIDVTTTC